MNRPFSCSLAVLLGTATLLVGLTARSGQAQLEPPTTSEALPSLPDDLRLKPRNPAPPTSSGEVQLRRDNPDAFPRVDLRARVRSACNDPDFAGALSSRECQQAEQNSSTAIATGGELLIDPITGEAVNNLGRLQPPSTNPLSVAVAHLGRQLGNTLNVAQYLNRTARPAGLQSNGDRQLLFPLTVQSAISSTFGWRLHPVFGDYRMHTGTDIAAPIGTPVVAAFSGTVSIADFLGGYGLTVVLEHQNPQRETLYAHLSELFVKPGDRVKQGEVIGRVGMTGTATGPHLHFELRQLQGGNWVAVNSDNQLQQALGGIFATLQGEATGTDNQLALLLSRLLQVLEKPPA